MAPCCLNLFSYQSCYPCLFFFLLHFSPVLYFSALRHLFLLSYVITYIPPVLILLTFLFFLIILVFLLIACHFRFLRFYSPIEMKCPEASLCLSVCYLCLYFFVYLSFIFFFIHFFHYPYLSRKILCYITS